DPGVGLDARHEILRHRFGEVPPAHGELHGTPLLREVERRLSGRIATADDDHGRTATDTRLEIGRGVEDARTFEPLEIVDLEAAVLRARCDDDGPGRDLTAVGENDDVKAFFDPKARDRARRAEPGAESHRLDCRPGDEIVAGDAVRESDVVLDARAR